MGKKLFILVAFFIGIFIIDAVGYYFLSENLKIAFKNASWVEEFTYRAVWITWGYLFAKTYK